eukprot:UN29404
MDGSKLLKDCITALTTIKDRYDTKKLGKEKCARLIHRIVTKLNQFIDQCSPNNNNNINNSPLNNGGQHNVTKKSHNNHQTNNSTPGSSIGQTNNVSNSGTPTKKSSKVNHTGKNAGTPKVEKFQLTQNMKLVSYKYPLNADKPPELHTNDSFAMDYLSFQNNDDNKEEKLCKQTKLPNEKSFFECGNMAKRTKIGPKYKWGMVLLNIDNMKILNDRYGQEAGNIAILTMGKNIQNKLASCLPNALFFHLSGDDFAIICPTSSENTLYTIINEIRSAISKIPVEVKYQKTKKRKRVRLSVSGGLLCLTDGIKFNQWRKACQKALASAKQSGKNRIVIAPKSAIQNRWSKELYTNVANFVDKPDYIIPMAQRLIQHGANVNYQDPFNRQTALMIALEKRSNDLVKILIKTQIDINLQDTNGKTVVIYA